MSFGYTSVIHKPNTLRILGIAAGLLISLPLFGMIFFNADSFFARASDEIPRDVIMTEVGKSEATLSWTTDNNTQAVIEYGTSPTEMMTYAPEVEAKKDHEVVLTLLAPSTTYYFQIRIGDKVHDNGGVPWTFTTRSLTGEDPLKQVKGITTRLRTLPDDPLKESSTSAKLSTGKCEAQTCEEIKNMLGKGCSARDYIQCLANPPAATGSGTTGGSSSPISYSTPYPTPTSILIVSNLCKIDYLQTENNCMTWTWDNFDTKPYTCREGFDRYILQCRNKSFENNTNNTDPMVWYYNSSITNIATNSATFKVTPSSGSTVYCQIRAEDEIGGDSHATAWLRASKKCD